MPTTTKATRSKATRKGSQVARLAELLEQVRFSAADLQEIGDMPTVRGLAFRKGSVFARGGLAALARIKNLQFLTFDGSKLTRDDLSACAACRGLRRLGLEGCTFPAAGLAALAGMPRLADLWLQRTPIGDPGLAHLSGIATLEWLILDDTAVTDRGLRHLAGLPRLRTLRLRNTRVTDAGIMTLAAAPQVRFSPGCFAGTPVTQAGLDAAFAARRAKGKAGRTRDPAARDAQAASAVVGGFIAAKNAWEKACHQGCKRGRDLNELRPDHDAILARFCTRKNRASAEVVAYCVPPQYDPRTEKVQEVEAKGRDRLEVHTRRTGADPARRIYVVSRIAGEWRIDSVRSSSGGAFRPAIL